MMISTSPWQLDDPISRRVLHQLYLSILCHHGNGRVTESGSTYRSRVSQSLYSFCSFTVPRVLSFHKQYILPPYHFLSLYIYTNPLLGHHVITLRSRGTTRGSCFSSWAGDLPADVVTNHTPPIIQCLHLHAMLGKTQSHWLYPLSNSDSSSTFKMNSTNLQITFPWCMSKECRVMLTLWLSSQTTRHTLWYKLSAGGGEEWLYRFTLWLDIPKNHPTPHTLSKCCVSTFQHQAPTSNPMDDKLVKNQEQNLLFFYFSEFCSDFLFSSHIITPQEC